MTTPALLIAIFGALVGIGLLSVGIWWRSGGKTLRIVIGIAGGVMAVSNIGLLGVLAYTVTTDGVS